MAITYISAGTYVSGNNTNVTPGIPAGYAAGDLFIMLVAHRVRTATITTPAGYTLVGTIQGTTLMKLSIFWKRAAASETAVAVSFTGGATNGTTQAQITCFRGIASTGTPVVPETLYIGSYALTGIEPIFDFIEGSASTPETYAEGTGYLAAWAYGNDVIQMTDGGISGFDMPAGDWLSSSWYVNNTTITGSDASLGLHFASLKYYTGSPASAQGLQNGSNVVDTGCVYGVRILPKPTLRQIGSGGAKVGGISDCRYANGPVLGTATAKVGGAADYSIRYSQMPFTGGGQSKVGGASTHGIRYSQMPFSGSGMAKAGGAATYSYRPATLNYTGNLTSRVGGSAVSGFIHPNYFYIDPFNGNDANTGLSWVQAFKTFRPITARVVTPVPGDVIKIAKTPEPEVLADLLMTYYNFAEMTSNGNAFPAYTALTLPASISGRIRSISQLSTGYVAGAGITISQDSAVAAGAFATAQMTVMHTAALTIGQKLFHATAAWTNMALSGFGRLEMAIFVKQTGVNGAQLGMPTWTLHLCSDTLGVTSLLAIPVQLHGNGRCVWSWEGTLPDGVNSVRMDVATQGWGCRVYLRDLIATFPYTHASYLGHHTLWTVGDYESSVWNPPIQIYGSGTSTFVMWQRGEVGPNALYRTNQPIRIRKSVAFSDQYHATYQSAYATTGAVPFDFTNAAAHINASGMRYGMDLTNLAGSTLANIEIVGGWDTATDTVTGVTQFGTPITGRWYVHATEMSRSGASFFAFDNSSYLTFKNINVVSMIYGLFHVFPTDNHHFRFENCNMTFCSLDGYADTTTPTQQGVNIVNYQGLTTAWYTDTTTKFRDVYFKNCKGGLWLQNIHAMPLKPTMVYNITHENCVWFPYARRGYESWSSTVKPTYFGGTYGIAPPDAPIDVVGTLTIWSKTGNANTYYNQIVAPSFVNNCQGVVHVYKAGTFAMSYWMPPGSYDATYTFPTMMMYDARPLFYSAFDSLGETNGPNWVGRAGFMSMPSLTITCTSVNWCDEMFNNQQTTVVSQGLVSASAVAFCPPAEVGTITLIGAPKVYADPANATERTGFFSSVHNSVSIKSVIGSASWTKFVLVGRAGQIASPVARDALAIVEGASFPAQLNMIGSATDWVGGVMAGYLDIRNTTFNYGTLPPINTSKAAVWGTVRLKDSPVTVGAANIFMNGFGDYIDTTHSWYSGIPVGAPGTFGFVFEGGAAPLGTGITGTNTVNELAYEVGYMRQGQAVTVMSGSSHTIYTQSSILAKDTTDYVSPPFSWKSTLRRNAQTLWSNRYPVGSVPLKTQKVVTFSINLKRATTANNKICLMVVPNGTNGFNIGDNFAEITEYHTAAAGAWQTVTISYFVRRSAMVDIYVSHYGASGSIALFDDLRIIEL